MLRASIIRDGIQALYLCWARGSSAPGRGCESEAELEQRRSEGMGRMRVAWLAVLDKPGADSGPGLIGRGATTSPSSG